MSSSDWASGRILVLGAQGMLGRELVDTIGRRMGHGAGDRLLAWSPPELDIRDQGAVFRLLREHKPSVVLNAVAYTDVDGCETNTDVAMAVNADAPGHIALACAELSATLVHFGTDFVFDGKKDRPYTPDDRPNPLSVYGRTKWEGEQGVRATGCHHLIVRTSWLFGPHGRNFVETILGRAQSGQALSVVNDQIGRPTLATHLAEAVVRLLDVGARNTVHFANSGRCSWFEFAQEIVNQAGVDVVVRPIRSDQLARPARRPAYSVLDLAKYVGLVGCEPPSWQDALKRYLELVPQRVVSDRHE